MNFLKKFAKRLYLYTMNRARKKNWEEYTVRHFNYAIKNCDNWKPLSNAQKKEIVDFWSIRHPWKCDFMTHEIMMNIKGEFDVRYCPENTFRIYLDDSREFWPWIDKNYFDRHQPNLPFPYTYVRNVNGYFLDHDYHLISKEDAKKIIVENLPLIIKPTIFSGSGVKIKLISNEKEADEIFTQYDKHYLLQERIVQCDEFNKLSPRSVASLRIITAMVNGKPIVLKKHILGSTRDSIAVNAHVGSDAVVFVVTIDDDGILSDEVICESTPHLRKLESGISFGGLQIPAFKEIIDLVLEAHASMPMLDFVGWDVTVDKNNKPVFIEWNQRSIEIYVTQLSQGPLFGEYTDYFAEIVRKRARR